MVDHETVTEEGGRPLPALQRRREVLVVDDDVTVRDALSRLLSCRGCDVTLAGNGLEAGALLARGSYDLVITDLEMPLMNGWELSRLVKERSPKTPVIVVTGLNDHGHWEKMNMRYVDAIVMKPFRPEEIHGTVQRLLSNGTQ